MIEPIAAQALIPPAIDGPPSQVTLSPAEIEAFEAAVQNANGADMPSLELEAPKPIRHEVSITEIISEAVSNLRNDQAGHIDKINDITLNPTGETNPLDMRELYSLQFEMIQLSLTQDFTTKVADKLSQGAQSLFRNQ